MTSTPLGPEDIRKLRELATAWGKVIARRAFGPQGPGLDVSLTVMEELALEVSRGLVEGTVQTLLQQQAQTLGEEHPCPDCQQLCPVKIESRPLYLKGGHQLQQDEPFCHCPDCRRDFFPPPASPRP